LATSNKAGAEFIKTDKAVTATAFAVTAFG
jgi:hypothetical protein